MRATKIISIAVVLLASFIVARSQEEVHFSQFTDAQTMFNPATVGVFHGSLRFNGHYRTQWGNAGRPYTTIGAAADFPLLSEVTGNDFLAMGVYGISDKAGLTEAATVNGGLNLNFGKSFDRSEEHFWSLGAKITYNQKKMTTNQFTHWGSQWDVVDGSGWQAGGAPILPGEVSKTYIGFGAGFNHFYSNHDNIRTMWGVSMNNINKPKVEFLNQEYQLQRSVYVHGEIEIHSHADNVAIIPRGAMLFQGPQRYFIFGSSLDFLIKEAGKVTGYEKELTFEIGVFHRWRDAMIFEAQFNWAGLGVGVSYDLPVSKISRSVNFVGALEFLLHYKLGYKTGLRSTHNNRRFDTIH